MSFAKNGLLTPFETYGRGRGMSAAGGDVGIEIELEGTGPLGVPCKGWDVHQENSLRGPGGVGHGGSEYVTRGAIALDNVPMLVERLATKLRAEGCTINEEAHRTSTHVHVNAQKMSFIDILGYLTVFSAIEPLFLHMCGSKRDGNSFCVPSYDAGDLPDYVHSFCKTMETYSPDHGLPAQGRGKYASLSTFRLHDLGTIECRAFPHSLDPATVHKWCTWLVNLRNLVVNQQDKSCRGLIKNGIHDPLLLSQSIFGNIYDLGVPTKLQMELLQYGSQEAYELTRILKFWLNKAPSEKKEKKKPDHGDLVANAADFARWVNVAPRPVAWGEDDVRIFDELPLPAAEPAPAAPRGPVFIPRARRGLGE